MCMKFTHENDGVMFEQFTEEGVFQLRKGVGCWHSRPYGMHQAQSYAGAYMYVSISMDDHAQRFKIGLSCKLH